MVIHKVSTPLRGKGEYDKSMHSTHFRKNLYNFLRWVRNSSFLACALSEWPLTSHGISDIFVFNKKCHVRGKDKLFVLRPLKTVSVSLRKHWNCCFLCCGTIHRSNQDTKEDLNRQFSYVTPLFNNSLPFARNTKSFTSFGLSFNFVT